jgi:hypothetical protein
MKNYEKSEVAEHNKKKERCWLSCPVWFPMALVVSVGYTMEPLVIPGMI